MLLEQIKEQREFWIQKKKHAAFPTSVKNVDAPIFFPCPTEPRDGMKVYVDDCNDEIGNEAPMSYNGLRNLKGRQDDEVATGLLNEMDNCSIIATKGSSLDNDLEMPASSKKYVSISL